MCLGDAFIVYGLSGLTLTHSLKMSRNNNKATTYKKKPSIQIEVLLLLFLHSKEKFDVNIFWLDAGCCYGIEKQKSQPYDDCCNCNWTKIVCIQKVSQPMSNSESYSLATKKSWQYSTWNEDKQHNERYKNFEPHTHTQKLRNNKF